MFGARDVNNANSVKTLVQAKVLVKPNDKMLQIVSNRYKRIYYEVLALAGKYRINNHMNHIFISFLNTVHYSVATAKEAVWSEFVSHVVF